MLFADAAPNGAGLGIVAAILLAFLAAAVFVLWMIVRAIRIRMRDNAADKAE